MKILPKHFLFAMAVISVLGLQVGCADKSGLPTRPKATGSLQQRSHPVAYVYNFFANWCDDCRIIQPQLDRLEERYGTRLEVVNVNVDTAVSHKLVQQFGINTIPSVVVLNKDKSHVITLRGPANGVQVSQMVNAMMSSRN